MVKAGQVSNPGYGRYALPEDTRYSAYPPNSSGRRDGDGKEGKDSKGNDGGGSARGQPVGMNEGQRVRRLISEGMSPEWARAEVLGLGIDEGGRG
jgi:hypothetical protein